MEEISVRLEKTVNVVLTETVFEIGDCKFANRAIIGTFSVMFNNLRHKNKFNDTELKKMYDAYPKRGEVSVDELFENIGGPLKDWYDKHPEQLANTCAIRLSVTLNKSGNTIPAGTGTFKGKDNKNYYTSVSSIRKYLTKIYETPTTLPANHVVRNAIIRQSSCG